MINCPKRIRWNTRRIVIQPRISRKTMTSTYILPTEEVARSLISQKDKQQSYSAMFTFQNVLIMFLITFRLLKIIPSSETQTNIILTFSFWQESFQQLYLLYQKKYMTSTAFLKIKCLRFHVKLVLSILFARQTYLEDAYIPSAATFHWFYQFSKELLYLSLTFTNFIILQFTALMFNKIEIKNKLNHPISL